MRPVLEAMAPLILATVAPALSEFANGVWQLSQLLT
jgi:hypothetical protein